jgi:hypothetical protein
VRRSEHRGHRTVDPDIDRTELSLDPLGCPIDLIRVADIGRDGERAISATS